MAVKLVLALLLLALILSVAIAAAFWYFRETAKFNHEEKMRRLERDEKMFTQDNIDRELEREKKR